MSQKNIWFKTWGWCHIPVSWQGWAIFVLAALFIVNVFWAIDRSSHSVSDTFYGVFPYFVSVAVLVEWIASKTSEK